MKRRIAARITRATIHPITATLTLGLTTTIWFGLCYLLDEAAR